MAERERLIDRSPEMLVSAYYLARCSVRRENASPSPPHILGASTWKTAYNYFFEAMGDGRTPSQFRNSIKNARDTFDIFFDNGRIGWISTGSGRASLGPRFVQIHETWEDRTDVEIEAYVIRLSTGYSDSHAAVMHAIEARTEGGDRVYISRRRERDPKLREDAIRIHGLDCIVCGFNFERTYGEIGRNFIEVHHVTPISESGLTTTDPYKDLTVVCANCHRMIRSIKGVCLSVDALRRRLSTSGDTSPT